MRSCDLHPLLLLTAALLALPTASAAERTPVSAARCRVILAEEAVLSSDRAGILAVIVPEEGDRVKAGQKIAGLKDEVAAAALAVAEKQATNDVEIRYAAKAAEVAEVEYRKTKEANRQLPNAFPEIELERLRLAYERAKLQIEKAELDFEVAKLTRDQAAAELAVHRINAPFDGVVRRVIKHRGEAVSQGDPILELVNVDRLRVEGYVPLADAFSLRPGDPVTVQLVESTLAPEIRNRVFEGKIGFIDEVVNKFTIDVRVWATVDNQDDLLRPGLEASMRVFPGKRATAQAAGPDARTANAGVGK